MNALGCNPPWISPTDTCNGTYHGQEYQAKIGKIFSETDYYAIINSYRVRPYESGCPRPCNITTSSVQFKRKFYAKGLVLICLIIQTVLRNNECRNLLNVFKHPKDLQNVLRRTSRFLDPPPKDLRLLYDLNSVL